MSRPFLSVIIPCYNEASRLPLTLIDVDRNLAGQDFESEIILVISQSTDATADIAKRFQGIIKNIRTINLSDNLGRGYAVKTGMLAHVDSGDLLWMPTIQQPLRNLLRCCLL
jgi:dolichyl-phosphate beta-glucosyltransferase